MNFVEDTPGARFVWITARASLLGPLGAAVCCIGLAFSPSLLSTLLQIFGGMEIAAGLGAAIASLVVGARADVQSGRVLIWFSIVVSVLFAASWIVVRTLLHLYSATGLPPS